MAHYLAIFMSALLINNLVLTRFFGLDPILGAEEDRRAILPFGFILVALIVVSSVLFWMTERYILSPYATSILYRIFGGGGDIAEFDFRYLRLLVYVVLSVSIAEISSALVLRLKPLLGSQSSHAIDSIAAYLPIAAINCALIGTGILGAQKFGGASSFSEGLIRVVLQATGGGVGLLLILFLMHGIREKLSQTDLPEPFRGTPSILISLGLIALAFMGFAGIF